VVRVTRKLALVASRHWIRCSRKKVTRARNRLQVVGDFAGCRVKAKEECLLALLDMVRGCGIAKTEFRLGINCLENLAEIHGPKTECVNFYRDDLSEFDRRGSVHDTHPSKIEHLPIREGTFGRVEYAFS